MPGPVQQNFNIHAFQQATQNVADDQNLVLKAQGFEAKGKLGTFFAGKTASRNAANALFNALQKEYGSTIADALSPQLRDSMIKGKPLSARTVHSVLTEAQTFRQAIGNANAQAVHVFADGNRDAGDTRNIDHALAPLFAELQVPADQQQALKDSIQQGLAEKAAQSDRLLSFQDLKEISSNMVISAVQDAHADRLSAQHGLNAEQSAQMRQLVQLSAAQDKTTPPLVLCRMAANAELPGQAALLFALGKLDHPDAAVRDTMLLATDANRVDMALVAENTRIGGTIALNVRIMEKLPEMRQMQPEGPLSRETLWKGCFGEELSADLAEVHQRDFNSAMVDKIMAQFQAQDPSKPMAPYDGVMFLGNGLSMTKSSEAVRGPVTLTMEDFVSPPSLMALSRLPDMDDCERQLAKDLHRRGSHNSIEGFSPTISFGVPGQPVDTVHILNVMAGDEEDFHAGNPTHMSASLRRQSLELCGGNEVQARMLMMGLSQASTLTTRALSPASGAFRSEHSPHHMDVRRQEDGSVTLRVYTPHDSPLDADYTFTIRPDGEARLTSFRMGPAGDDAASNISRDPRLAHLSEASRQSLQNVLGNIAARMPQGPERQTAIENAKRAFLGIKPDGYDIEAGMQAFADSCGSEFLKPVQQGVIDAQGFHKSFVADARRGSIERIGDTETPPGQPPGFYENALKRAVPEEHHRFLPFISMMASQAGMDSFAVFLPQFSGAMDTGKLMAIGLNPRPGGDHHTADITPTANGLRIECRNIDNYFEGGIPGGSAVLTQTSRLTMEIDFTAAPTEHQVEVTHRDGTVEQRTVYIPHFTLTDGDIHLEAAHA